MECKHRYLDLDKWETRDEGYPCPICGEWITYEIIAERDIEDIKVAIKKYIDYHCENQYEVGYKLSETFCNCVELQSEDFIQGLMDRLADGF